MYKIKLFILKTIDKSLVLLKRGTSLTGYIDQKYKVNILKNIDFSDNEIIFIVGTNGKTTTSNLMYNIINEKNDIISNLEGANMLSGILTTLIRNIGYNKKIKQKYICLEVDEKSLKNIVRYINPNHIIITNFFRDQLDRYGEIDLIVDEIKNIIRITNASIYLNGCDPIIVSKFGSLKNKKYYFGLKENEKTVKFQTKTIELKYCPVCKNTLNYNYYHYGHIGFFDCDFCDFRQENLDISFRLNYEDKKIVIDGENFNFNIEDFPMYFYFNISAALLVVKKLNLFDTNITIKALNNFEQPKGRSQTIFDSNREIYLNLAKNVVGFEETLEYVQQKYAKFDLLICFNDNSADGIDVSWIWDVDISCLNTRVNNIYVTGLRRYDMALRFEMDGFNKINVLSSNIGKDTQMVLNKGNNTVIISNYTPLNEVNKVLNEFRK